MNCGGTRKRIIMMEYFYRKQTTQMKKKTLDNFNNGEVKCIQYKKVKMQVLGLAHSHQSQQKMFSAMIISIMTYRFME